MPFYELQNAYMGPYADPQPLRSDVYIVPVDKSFGFDSLTHGHSYGPSPYFGVQAAYPTHCTQFRYRECDQSKITNKIVTDSVLRPAQVNFKPTQYNQWN
jgi:hypothetical protein